MDLRWDVHTGVSGRIATLYGSRRDFQGHSIVHVMYYDPNGPGEAVFKIAETANCDIHFARKVTLKNGESAVLDLGSRESFRRRSWLRFSLYRENLGSSTDGSWIFVRSVRLGPWWVETFEAARFLSAEFPRRTTTPTGSRGNIEPVYGYLRSPSCDVLVRVSFYDPKGCKDEERTFVIRETMHCSVRFARSITLKNGQEAIVNLGDRATFRGRSWLRFSLQFSDGRGGWRTRESLFVGPTCIDLYEDDEDQARVLTNVGGGYDIGTGRGGRLLPVWGDKRAPSGTGWVDQAGESVDECDAIVSVAYNDPYGEDSRRFVLAPLSWWWSAQSSADNGARSLVVNNGEQKYVNLGSFAELGNDQYEWYSLMVFDRRCMAWIPQAWMRLGPQCIRTYPPAQLVAGYPLPNFAPTYSDAFLDYETVLGDRVRLCNGDVAIYLRFCEDERVAPASLEIILKETKNRNIDWAASVTLERCTETVVIVPSSEWSASWIEISAYTRDDSGNNLHRGCKTFGSFRRASVCASDLEVPAETRRLLQEADGSQSSTSIRHDITRASSMRSDLRVDATLASARALGSETDPELEIAAARVIQGERAAIIEAGGPDEFDLQLALDSAIEDVVTKAGVQAGVFANAAAEGGIRLSVMPPTQRLAAEAAVSAAVKSGALATALEAHGAYALGELFVVDDEEEPVVPDDGGVVIVDGGSTDNAGQNENATESVPPADGYGQDDGGSGKGGFSLAGHGELVVPLLIAVVVLGLLLVASGFVIVRTRSQLGDVVVEEEITIEEHSGDTDDDEEEGDASRTPRGATAVNAYATAEVAASRDQAKDTDAASTATSGDASGDGWTHGSRSTLSALRHPGSPLQATRGIARDSPRGAMARAARDALAQSIGGGHRRQASNRGGSADDRSAGTGNGNGTRRPRTSSVGDARPGVERKAVAQLRRQRRSVLSKDQRLQGSDSEDDGYVSPPDVDVGAEVAGSSCGSRVGLLGVAAGSEGCRSGLGLLAMSAGSVGGASGNSDGQHSNIAGAAAIRRASRIEATERKAEGAIGGSAPPMLSKASKQPSLRNVV